MERQKNVDEALQEEKAAKARSALRKHEGAKLRTQAQAAKDRKAAAAQVRSMTPQRPRAANS